MEESQSVLKILERIDDRHAELTSKVSQISENLAVVKEKQESGNRELIKLNKIIIDGNGVPSLLSKISAIDAQIAAHEAFVVEQRKKGNWIRNQIFSFILGTSIIGWEMLKFFVLKKN